MREVNGRGAKAEAWGWSESWEGVVETELQARACHLRSVMRPKEMALCVEAVESTGCRDILCRLEATRAKLCTEIGR